MVASRFGSQMPLTEVILKIGTAAGGLGLFLLAVTMITRGLKRATGQVLRDILARWTSTPLRGAVSGFLLGALAQSGSTVTVLTIGFVNSGVLALLNAVGLIYGANIGATVTGWLIAAWGVGSASSALAWPLIGAGILAQTFSRDERIGAIGEILAGLGLLFVGLDVLRESFSAIGTVIPVDRLALSGWPGFLLSIAAGFVLAALIHSGGAIVLILSALLGGAVPLPNALAAVVGINVGAAMPALLAALPGTPNAKRLSCTYLVVNLASVATIVFLYPAIRWSFADSEIALRLAAYPGLTFAAFHTIFNIAGTCLLWGATGRFAIWLERRFLTAEEEEGRPRYLDQTVIATPEVGIDALARELIRLGETARSSAVAALKDGRGALAHVRVRRIAVRSLAIAIDEFVRALRRRALSPGVGDALPTVLRVGQYYEEVAVLAERALSSRLALESRQLPILPVMREVYDSAARTIAVSDAGRPDFMPDRLAAELVAFLELYQRAKGALLRAGTEDLSVEDLSACLDQISRVRRMVEQAVKAARHSHAVRSNADHGSKPDEPATVRQEQERAFPR